MGRGDTDPSQEAEGPVSVLALQPLTTCAEFLLSLNVCIPRSWRPGQGYWVGPLTLPQTAQHSGPPWSAPHMPKHLHSGCHPSSSAPSRVVCRNPSQTRRTSSFTARGPGHPGVAVPRGEETAGSQSILLPFLGVLTSGHSFYSAAMISRPVKQSGVRGLCQRTLYLGR